MGIAPANDPPVLDPIGNKSVNEGSLLTFTATASDPNAGDVLTFSLDPGAPTGASINPTTGVFSWTPTIPGTFPVTVRATDSGSPSLSDAKTFTITVKAVPLFSGLSSSTITFGTAATTLSGHINAGSLIPIEAVLITLNGVTHTAAIAGSGDFSSSFDTSMLGASNNPYLSVRGRRHVRYCSGWPRLPDR